MDINNTFFTRTTYKMVRIDWLCIMLVLMFFSVIHWREMNWWVFALAFWWIDFVGTAPGMYFHGKNKGAPAGRDVPRWSIVAYNFCHSFLTVTIVSVVWYMYSGWEWAMLAMPMHLAADRCVFGNIYKNFGIKFDPKAIPAFTRFQNEFSTLQNETQKLSNDETLIYNEMTEKGGQNV
ncbi:MAG: hypothetical protein COA42_14345 [Alteromonadaceae bacterium]|nr:MAG: hypothetical protein COA42_14345 [Alteromonadaceae bacterium]